MACKKTCKKYIAINSDSTHARYAIGQKRCGTCEIFLIWDHDNNCPCCGHKLRIKPKNARLKRQYNKILKQKQQQEQLERSKAQSTFQVNWI